MWLEGAKELEVVDTFSNPRKLFSYDRTTDRNKSSTTETTHKFTSISKTNFQDCHRWLGNIFQDWNSAPTTLMVLSHSSWQMMTDSPNEEEVSKEYQLLTCNKLPGSDGLHTNFLKRYGKIWSENWQGCLVSFFLLKESVQLM